MLFGPNKRPDGIRHPIARRDITLDSGRKRFLTQSSKLTRLYWLFWRPRKRGIAERRRIVVIVVFVLFVRTGTERERLAIRSNSVDPPPDPPPDPAFHLSRLRHQKRQPRLRLRHPKYRLCDCRPIFARFGLASSVRVIRFSKSVGIGEYVFLRHLNRLQTVFESVRYHRILQCPQNLLARRSSRAPRTGASSASGIDNASARRRQRHHRQRGRQTHRHQPCEDQRADRRYRQQGHRLHQTVSSAASMPLPLQRVLTGFILILAQFGFGFIVRVPQQDQKATGLLRPHRRRLKPLSSGAPQPWLASG